MGDEPDAYSVRWYEPDDREDVLSLYAETFGGGGDEWFDWKYVDNPRVSHVPILVAERDEDGAFAGARPQVPFVFRVDGEDVVGLRFGDTMVHPDHRRRGVFTRLAERALEHYGSMPTEFCFNVPNDIARKGFLKAGGEVVGHLPSHYRIHDPGAFANVGSDGPIGGAVNRVAALAAGSYFRVRDRLAPRPERVSVRRHRAIPVSRLATLYERAVPEGIHAVRDEAFLRWRYENPEWTYEAFTASVDGEPTAGVVTGTQTEDGVTTTNLVDVLPLAGGDRRDAALHGILGAVTDVYADSDLLAYNGDAIPRSVLRAHGFHVDTAPPLSRVTSPTKLVTYDLTSGSEPWRVGSLDLRDGQSWMLSYAELDAR